MAEDSLLANVDREIIALYRALSARSGFGLRPSQVQLSQTILEAIVDERPLCAEAPTGTGKSLAYLIGGVVAARRANRPVVVATGTATLQGQIMNKDLPLLVSLGLLAEGEVALAKGRQRYFCPLFAQQLARRPQRAVARQDDLFGFDELPVEDHVPPERRGAARMLDTWSTGRWNGDIDQWRGQPPDVWPQIRMNRDGCVGSRCWAYQAGSCPFFAARARFQEASLVIANHDLVLADLKQRRENGEQAIFPFKDYIIVFDEAHHVPAKAIEHGTAKARVNGPQKWLKEMASFAERCTELEMVDELQSSPHWHQALGGRKLLRRMRDLGRALEARLAGLNEDRPHVLVDDELGPLGETFDEALHEANTAGWALHRQLQDVREALEHCVPVYAGAAGLLAEAGRFSGRLENTLSGYKQFRGADPDSTNRWVEFVRGDRGACIDYELCTAPLDSDVVMEQILWRQTSRVVMVSATLRVAGCANDGFVYFAESAALPRATRYLTLPHIFPYHNSVLQVPRIPHRPSGRDPEETRRFERAVIGWINRAIDPAEGTLVLFTSRRAMEEAVRRLRPALAECCLVQRAAGNDTLIEEHKARIDAGLGSLLFGMSSFSEGLDLSGRYCTHVVITRIPFEYPGTPILQARFKRLGRALYYEKSARPEATRRLVQAAGRLVRREEDRGRVTILDRRILSQFGLPMLDSLPAFSRHVA